MQLLISQNYEEYSLMLQGGHSTKDKFSIMFFLPFWWMLLFKWLPLLFLFHEAWYSTPCFVEFLWIFFLIHEGWILVTNLFLVHLLSPLMGFYRFNYSLVRLVSNIKLFFLYLSWVVGILAYSVSLYIESSLNYLPFFLCFPILFL